jgi:hypothetical protein
MRHSGCYGHVGAWSVPQKMQKMRNTPRGKKGRSLCSTRKQLAKPFY